MKTKPLISIITVSFNTVNTIEQTILSVINQTYPNIEYIIIDGGSTDGTIEIIKKYADKISYWISEPDKGIYDAMNKGALKATGDYIQYLNASDRISTNKTIENIISNMPINAPDIIYGDIIMEKSFGTFHLAPKSLSNFKTTFPIFHPSTWMKTSLLLKHKFDSSFKIAADFKLFRELYYENCRFYYVPIIFTVFEAIEGVSSTNYYKCWLEEQYIIDNKIGRIHKIVFYIKNKLKSNLFKFTHFFIPSFQRNRDYVHFVRNCNIKNIISSN